MNFKRVYLISLVLLAETALALPKVGFIDEAEASGCGCDVKDKAGKYLYSTRLGPPTMHLDGKKVTFKPKSDESYGGFHNLHGMKAKVGQKVRMELSTAELALEFDGTLSKVNPKCLQSGGGGEYCNREYDLRMTLKKGKETIMMDGLKGTCGC